eukprot:scaffold149351_cov24-Prasinocladus_malaysianus.AAC.2
MAKCFSGQDDIRNRMRKVDCGRLERLQATYASTYSRSYNFAGTFAPAWPSIRVSTVICARVQIRLFSSPCEAYSAAQAPLQHH